LRGSEIEANGGTPLISFKRKFDDTVVRGQGRQKNNYKNKKRNFEEIIF
jgi:hypothetical protein